MARARVARPQLGRDTLQHAFRTVANAAKDPVAVYTVMRHVNISIDSNDTHGVGHERLTAVADLVRAWLYHPTQRPTGHRDG